MVATPEFPSRQLAALARAAASLSNQLSIATVLGLAFALLPPRDPTSAAARQGTPFPAGTLAAPQVPVEMVRAKPVPLAEAAALPDPAPAAAKGPAPVRILQAAAQRSRDRKQPESGGFGKAGDKAPATPADAKAAAAPADPNVWSDAEIIAALRDCLRRLAPLGAEIEIADPVRQERCGAPAPVVLKRIGSGAGAVEFRPAPVLNCAMVARLHTWVEKTLQPAAQELLGSRVARIRSASGYVCRNRVGSALRGDRLSEHGLANAIDISGFVMADGRVVDVVNGWGPTARDLRERQERAAEAAAEAKAAAKEAQREAEQARRAIAKAAKGEKRELAKAEAARKKEEAKRKGEEAERLDVARRKAVLRTTELQKLGRASDAKVGRGQTPRLQRKDQDAAVDARGLTPATTPAAETVFLRRLHDGACGTFSTVLGPDANEAHRNHFHFDLASRKRNAYCE